jgi:hypothetical protein
MSDYLSYEKQVTGTGAALPVKIGYDPSVVIVANETHPGLLIWTPSMGSGKGFRVALSGDVSFLSSGGIVPSENYISIGTNAINTSGDILDVIAFR